MTMYRPQSGTVTRLNFYGMSSSTKGHNSGTEQTLKPAVGGPSSLQDVGKEIKPEPIDDTTRSVPPIVLLMNKKIDSNSLLSKTSTQVQQSQEQTLVTATDTLMKTLDAAGSRLEQSGLETIRDSQSQMDIPEKQQDQGSQSHADGRLFQDMKEGTQTIDDHDPLTFSFGKIKCAYNLIMLRRHLLRHKRQKEDFNSLKDEVRSKDEISRCQRVRNLAISAWDPEGFHSNKTWKKYFVDLVYDNWSNITVFGLDFLNPQILAMAWVERLGNMDINKKISKQQIESFLKRSFQISNPEAKHVTFMQKLFETKNISERKTVAQFIYKHYRKSIKSNSWNTYATGRLKELILQIAPDERQFNNSEITPRTQNPPADEQANGTDQELSKEELDVDAGTNKRFRKRENKDHVGEDCEQSKKRKTAESLSAESQAPNSPVSTPSPPPLTSETSGERKDVSNNPMSTSFTETKPVTSEKIGDSKVFENSTPINSQHESQHFNTEVSILPLLQTLSTIKSAIYVQNQTLSKQLEIYNEQICSVQSTLSDQENLVNSLDKAQRIIKNLKEKNGQLITELKNRDNIIIKLHEQAANDFLNFEEEKAKMIIAHKNEIDDIKNNFEKSLTVKNSKIQQALVLLQEQ